MYEGTRDQPMPGPFPAPPIFEGKSPGDEVEKSCPRHVFVLILPEQEEVRHIRLRVDFHCRVIFTCVNEIEVIYERSLIT